MEGRGRCRGMSRGLEELECEIEKGPESSTHPLALIL